MALEIPWSNTSVFIPGGNFVSGDILVGLRSGVNQQFNSPVGQFLQIANNFSDIGNILTAAANIGCSNGYVRYSDNADHTIPSPIPEVIVIDNNSSDRTFTLPSKASLNANTFGRMYFINNQGAFPQTFMDSLGNIIFSVRAQTDYIFVIPDQLSSNYYIFSLVNTVNSNSGDVTIDLNSAYSETSGQDFNVASGLNIIGSGTSTVEFSALSQVGINVGSTYTETLLQVDSTTQGVMFPRLNNAQEAALGFLDSPTGLEWYNTNNNTKKYFDGIDTQEILTIENIIAGANMNVTDNGNGTVTLASTGGSGGTVVTAQANYTFALSTVNINYTTNQLRPISVDSTKIVPGYLNNFVINNIAIPGPSTTPSVQNTSSLPKYCAVNAIVNMTGTSNPGGTWWFLCLVIRSADGLTATATPYQPYFFTGTSNFYVSQTIVGTVLLQAGESVEIWIKNDTGTSTTAQINGVNFQLIDTTETGGLASTDFLAQGTNHLYLSTDGGTTYENVNGSAVVGNVASFFNTSGKIQDSGVAVTNLVKNDAGTYNINVSGNAATATSAGSATTAVTATNANNVHTNQASTNANYFPLFAASSTNSNQLVDLGLGLTFNPSTNVLTTTTFAGALSGNATSATTATTATNANNVATTQVSNNASYFPLLAASSTNSNQAPDLATGLSFNPSTNFMTMSGLNLPNGQALVLGATSANQITITSSAGANNRADIALNRNDFTNGNCRFFFQTNTANQWSNGMRGGSGDYQVFDEVNAVTQLRMTQGSSTAGVSTFAGSVVINSGSTALTFQNGAAINAKNTGGTSSVFMYPRFGDNKTYMDIGSAGATFRQDAAGATWMSVDTSSNVTLNTGNLVINTAASGYQQKSAALSGGTANAILVTAIPLTTGASGTLNNSAVTAAHIGIVIPTTRSGTQAGYTVTCGSGTFSIAGGSLDSSTVAVLFIKPI